MKVRKGDLVRVNSSFLSEPAGVVGFVYEEYTIGEHRGVSIITQNGVDLGGFSEQEQEQYVSMMHHTGFMYQFRNVIQLDADWKKGVFKNVFAGHANEKKKYLN